MVCASLRPLPLRCDGNDGLLYRVAPSHSDIYAAENKQGFARTGGKTIRAKAGRGEWNREGTGAADTEEQSATTIGISDTVPLL